MSATGLYDEGGEEALRREGEVKVRSAYNRPSRGSRTRLISSAEAAGWISTQELLLMDLRVHLAPSILLITAYSCRSIFLVTANSHSGIILVV
jgi:hypothetical protein